MKKNLHFEIFEEKHPPPDWEAIGDQLSHWIYDRETFDLINKKLQDGQYATYDDPEDMLTERFQPYLNWKTEDFADQMKERSRKAPGRFLNKVETIALNFEDVDKGYSLLPLPPLDLLKVFYPAVTDRDYKKIGTSITIFVFSEMALQLLSDDGLIAIQFISANYSEANKALFVHLRDPSWSPIAEAHDYAYYKTIMAGWVVAAHHKTGVPVSHFIGDDSREIIIPYWVWEEFDALQQE